MIVHPQLRDIHGSNPIRFFFTQFDGEEEQIEIGILQLELIEI